MLSEQQTRRAICVLGLLAGETGDPEIARLAAGLLDELRAALPAGNPYRARLAPRDVRAARALPASISHAAAGRMLGTSTNTARLVRIGAYHRGIR